MDEATHEEHPHCKYGYIHWDYWTGKDIECAYCERDGLQRERDEVAELLAGMVDQHCPSFGVDRAVESLIVIANAAAMRYLARIGKMEIIQDDGDRVTGRWRKPEQEGGDDGKA